MNYRLVKYLEIKRLKLRDILRIGSILVILMIIVIIFIA